MSASDFTKRTTCRLCRGPLTEVLEIGATALANEYVSTPDEPQDLFPLYLSECVDCKHVQLPVVVDPERLFRNYVYVSSTSPMMQAHLRSQAKELAVLARGGLVVEIASNDGFLLQCFKDLGLKAVGVDPAKNLADEANARGLTTVPEFFTRHVAECVRRAHGRAGLIVANNVFAHVDDLSGIVSGVKALLSPDGVFCFEVGYFADVLEGGLFDTIYHEHLSYHTLLPLISFFDRHDLYLYDAHRVASQGGSIRVFVSKIKRARSPRLQSLMRAELLLNPRTMAEKIERVRGVVHAAIDQYGPLVGFGAPAKLTTMMAALGLTRDHVSLVLDDNPLKIGKFTPGTHIHIHSSGPDGMPWTYRSPILLFSWNFADDLVPRLKRDGYSGPIVVPLPCVLHAHREVA